MKKDVWSILAPLACGLSLGAGMVQAGTLATDTSFKGGSVDVFYCIATNVGTKPLKEVTVAVTDVNGSNHQTETCTDLEPGRACQAGGAGGPSAAFCRVTFKGPARGVRASLIGANDATNEPLVVHQASK